MLASRAAGAWPRAADDVSSNQSTYPAEEEGFPRVAQSDQQHSTSDGFACEKILQKN